MKKIILIFSVLALFAFTPDQNKEYTYKHDASGYSITGKVVNIDDMRYLVLSADGGYTSPFVVNLTKDKLECAYYRKQLSQK